MLDVVNGGTGSRARLIPPQVPRRGRRRLQGRPIHIQMLGLRSTATASSHEAEHLERLSAVRSSLPPGCSGALLSNKGAASSAAYLYNQAPPLRRRTRRRTRGRKAAASVDASRRNVGFRVVSEGRREGPDGRTGVATRGHRRRDGRRAGGDGLRVLRLRAELRERGPDDRRHEGSAAPRPRRPRRPRARPRVARTSGASGAAESRPSAARARAPPTVIRAELPARAWRPGRRNRRRVALTLRGPLLRRLGGRPGRVKHEKPWPRARLFEARRWGRRAPRRRAAPAGPTSPWLAFEE